MKGEAQVIERLNEALFLELGAVNQYWVHFRLWTTGAIRSSPPRNAESIEEMHHADRLIERIIFLEGHPNLQRRAPANRSDHQGSARSRPRRRIRRPRRLQGQPRAVRKPWRLRFQEPFEALLTDEEGHIDFLETQLELLSKIGDEKYGQLNSASADEAE